MRRIVVLTWPLVAALALIACSPGPAEESNAERVGDAQRDTADAPDPDGTQDPTKDSSAQDTTDEQNTDGAQGAGGFDDPAELMPPTEQFPTTKLVLRDDDTRVALAAHVAADSQARSRGLMEREELPERAGMVFLYPEDHRGGFWMKNTLLPLSIAFFDADGRVVEVLDMEPCAEEPCPTYEPDATYRGALEVNQGAFARFGLEGTGWTVDLPEDLPEPR